MTVPTLFAARKEKPGLLQPGFTPRSTALGAPCKGRALEPSAFEIRGLFVRRGRRRKLGGVDLLPMMEATAKGERGRDDGEHNDTAHELDPSTWH
jgi:hypothetical protein